MAARSSPPEPFDERQSRFAIEQTARLAIASAKPSPRDILSLWPSDQRERLVLWAFVGPANEVAIAARFRKHAFDGALRALSHDLRRIRGDVPVVVELHDGRTIIMPLRALSADE
jgi:hypothetical protein